MIISLASGQRKIPVTLDDSRVMAVLAPASAGHPPSEAQETAEIVRALENPIGSPPLAALAGPGRTVAIVTSDVTRPCPSRRLLPPLLDELARAGVRKRDVCIVFALGSHRPHTPQEKERLVGPEILSQYACLDSDPADCTLVGLTGRGTPLEIFRPVAQADLRICLGNIEYHYFAGYSGGAKAIFPGVSTTRSIQANHRMMVEDGAATGVVEGNPVRADIEELSRFLPVDFILNVVLGAKKEILKAVAGHFIAAHRAGCEFLDSIYKFPLPHAADIVLVSAGGYPKDLNMYQAQKALDNARFAVRQGGVIILVAACPEKYGSATFERWIKAATSPESIIADIAKNFELGGHKAAAIALALRKATVLSVSDMGEDVARSLFFTPMATVEDALAEADRLCGADARILVMPLGGSTLPVVAA
jgi:nickel-dependent lactate racemase